MRFRKLFNYATGYPAVWWAIPLCDQYKAILLQVVLQCDGLIWLCNQAKIILLQVILLCDGPFHCVISLRLPCYRLSLSCYRLSCCVMDHSTIIRLKLSHYRLSYCVISLRLSCYRLCDYAMVLTYAREVAHSVQSRNDLQFVVIEIQFPQCLQSRQWLHVWNQVLTEHQHFHFLQQCDWLRNGFQTAVSEIHLLVEKTLERHFSTYSVF